MIFNFFAAQSIVVKFLYPTLVLRIQEQHRLWGKKISPILEKQRGLGLKYFHWGINERIGIQICLNIDFLRDIYKGLSLSCFPSWAMNSADPVFSFPRVLRILH